MLDISNKIFQSTPPRRERLSKPTFRASLSVISIHAPAKGATAQPATTEKAKQFQSTPPRRERQVGLKAMGLTKYFNPRPREGSDCDIEIEFSILKISIHAPAKGATTRPAGLIAVIKISIHAPAKGATLSSCRIAP